MQPRWAGWRAGAAFAVVVAAGTAAGCGDEGRFFIVQNQSPEAGCLISAEAEHGFRGRGRLDVNLVGDDAAFAYAIYPLLQNDLPRSNQAGAPEPNRLTIEAFTVALELDGEPPAAARKAWDDLLATESGKRYFSFEERIAATLEAGGARIGASVDVFPAEIARRLRASGALAGVASVRTVVKLRARGHRQAGTLETPEFRFPLEICAGCLTNVLGACPVTKRENEGHACNLAQDLPVDCCTQSGGLRCPAPLADKTTTTP
jgi:hypothetical protein